MLILLLLSIPIAGILVISTNLHLYTLLPQNMVLNANTSLSDLNNKRLKSVALNTSILTLLISLIIFAFFDLSSNQFQFVQEYHEIGSFSLYLGIDGLSIYFVLLTTIIMPISLLSN